MISAKKAVELSPEARRQMAVRERLSGLSETEIIRVWYESEEPFDLHPREDLIRRRWEFAKAKFLSRKTYGEVAQALIEEFNISIAQARIDIRNMRHTFGPLDEVPKKVHRAVAIEMATKAYNMAHDKSDVDGMAKAAKIYIMAAGLDKDDAEQVDMEKMMKDRTYVEVIDPGIRNLLLNLLAQSGGALDASALYDKLNALRGGEFIDYEDAADQPAPAK